MARTDTVPITIPFVNSIFAVSRMTMLSANRLFRKCAKIGTRILSVFKYRMAMQIAKINADEILPKGCMDANNRDVINIENIVGTTSLSLFNRTPLKISSSEIGEMITVAIKLPTAAMELFKNSEDNLKVTMDSIVGNAFKIKLDKYRSP